MKGAQVALITGGAGFIGSSLVRRLARDPGFGRVVVLDALTYAGRRDNLDGIAGLEWTAPIDLEVADVCDRARVSQILGEARPDVIFHLAAESHVDRSIDDPEPFFRTNVGGTLALFEAVRGARESGGGATRIVHVSTDEVLGEPAPGVWLDETAGCAPRSPYAASKAAGEHIARAWGTTHGMDVVVVRPANVYGPRQFPEKLVPLAALRAASGASIPLYGDGSAQRDWLHVDDACEGLVRAARAPAGTVLHLATGIERSALAVVHAIGDALDALRPRASHASHRELIERVADRPGHDRRYGIDGAETRRLLDWVAGVPFEDGIRSTVAWYLDHEAWCQAAGHDRGRLGLGAGRALAAP